MTTTTTLTTTFSSSLSSGFLRLRGGGGEGEKSLSAFFPRRRRRRHEKPPPLSAETTTTTTTTTTTIARQHQRTLVRGGGGRRRHRRRALKTGKVLAAGASSSWSNDDGRDPQREEEEEEERDATFAKLFAETLESASSSSSSSSNATLWEILDSDELEAKKMMTTKNASSSSSSSSSSSLNLDEEKEAGSFSSVLSGINGSDTARQREQQGRSRSQSASVVARWNLVAKYGHKDECIKMLHEWADTVGRAAGLDPVRDIVLISGNIGAIESTIELEIRNGLSSVGDFHELVQNIDVNMHREWGMRFAEHVVDGTTKWEIFTVHPFSTGNSNSNSSTSKYSRPGVSRTQPRRVLSPQKKKTSTEGRSSANGVRPKYEDIPEEELMQYVGKTLPDGRRVVENAFGVPMVVNPGDIFFD